MKCVLCPRPSKFRVWRQHLCIPCAASLVEAMPSANEKAFTERWLAARKGRAA
jgi:hypothetical protein